MNRSGFSFIELILGITISSIMSFVLFMAYNQTSRSMRNLDKIIALDNKVTVVQNQLERDISGIFAPDVTEVKPEEQKKSNEPKEKKEQKEQVEKNSEAEKKNQESTKRKFLQRTFYAENQGKSLNEMTFITCNPLQVYGESKPRIVRVNYKLKNDGSPNSYALFRQESSELIFGAAKSSIEYEVTNGIKEISATYMVPELPQKNEEIQKDQDKQQKEKKANEQKEQKLKIFNEWKFENKNDNNFVIPLYVNIKITFWEDANHTLEQKFEFKYIVYAFDSQFPKKKKSEKKFEDAFKVLEEMRKKAGIIDKIEQDEKQKKQNR